MKFKSLISSVMMKRSKKGACMILVLTSILILLYQNTRKINLAVRLQAKDLIFEGSNMGNTYSVQNYENRRHILLIAVISSCANRVQRRSIRNSWITEEKVQQPANEPFWIHMSGNI